MLDVFQGFEYATGLVFCVLTLLVYYCEFTYKSYLIHFQALMESIFGQLWLAASLNKRDPAYSNLGSNSRGGWWNLPKSLKHGRSNSYKSEIW